MGHTLSKSKATQSKSESPSENKDIPNPVSANRYPESEQLPEEEWVDVTHSNQYYRPEYGKFQIYQHKDSRDQYERYTLNFTDRQQLEDFREITHWRSKSKYLVEVETYEVEPNKEFCSSQSKVDLYIERIPFRLSDLTDIPFPETLYFMLSALKGFKYIFSCPFTISNFKVSEHMVCITREGLVKVWMHSDLSRNEPMPSPQKQEYYTQQDVIESIIKIIDENSESSSNSGVPFSFREYLSHKRVLVTGDFNAVISQVYEFAADLRVKIPEISYSVRDIINRGNVDTVLLKNASSTLHYQYDSSQEGLSQPKGKQQSQQHLLRGCSSQRENDRNVWLHQQQQRGHYHGGEQAKERDQKMNQQRSHQSIHSDRTFPVGKFVNLHKKRSETENSQQQKPDLNHHPPHAPNQHHKPYQHSNPTIDPSGALNVQLFQQSNPFPNMKAPPGYEVRITKRIIGPAGSSLNSHHLNTGTGIQSRSVHDLEKQHSQYQNQNYAHTKQAQQQQGHLDETVETPISNLVGLQPSPLTPPDLSKINSYHDPLPPQSLQNSVKVQRKTSVHTPTDLGHNLRPFDSGKANLYHHIQPYRNANTAMTQQGPSTERLSSTQYHHQMDTRSDNANLNMGPNTDRHTEGQSHKAYQMAYVKQPLERSTSELNPGRSLKFYSQKDSQETLDPEIAADLWKYIRDTQVNSVQ